VIGRIPAQYTILRRPYLYHVALWIEGDGIDLKKKFARVEDHIEAHV